MGRDTSSGSVYLKMMSYRSSSALFAHISARVIVQSILETVDASSINHFLRQPFPVVYHSNAEVVDSPYSADSWLVQFQDVPSSVVFAAGQLEELVSLIAFPTCRDFESFYQIPSYSPLLQSGRSQ